MKKQIKIDPKNTEKKFSKSWKTCVGSGNMSLMMRKEAVDALTMVQEEIGFDYIRGHGILSDVMATYQENEDYSSPFNFTYVDQVYDQFQKLHIRPVVELSFMPRSLASGEETVFYWKGNISLPKSWDKWCFCVDGLVRHLIERYGLEEVRKWPFEVWNEPNFSEFWVAPNLDEYWPMYTCTADTIKKIDSKLIVGGPAADTNGDEYLDDFLGRCRANNTPLDFVSRHAYMSTAPERKGDFDYQKFHKWTFILDKIHNARVIMERHGYQDLPLWITEFNTSYTPKNPIHDTVENAAMIAPVLARGGEEADAMAYWTFSDVFEELGIPRSEFHGGFGLVGNRLVKKPTYHLYRMMNKMKNNVLYQDENLLVTGDGAGKISALGWNMTGEELEYEFTVPAQKDSMSVLREEVSKKCGDSRTTWADLGYPRYPSQEELEAIHKASEPGYSSTVLHPENDAFTVKLTVPGIGVCLTCLNEYQRKLSDYDYMEDDKILIWEEE